MGCPSSCLSPRIPVTPACNLSKQTLPFRLPGKATFEASSCSYANLCRQSATQALSHCPSHFQPGVCSVASASHYSSSCTHRLKTGIMSAPGAVASSPGAPGGAWPGASLGMSCATDACPEGGLPRPAGASAECAPGGTSSPAFAACTCSACEIKVLIAERQHLTECALHAHASHSPLSSVRALTCLLKSTECL